MPDSAASVAFSRVYTGVHYPSDVLVGCALGIGAALALRALRPPAGPRPTANRPVPAPALEAGRGLHVVVNTASGPPPLLTPTANRVRAALPEAVVVERTEDEDLGQLMETAAKAARDAVRAGRAARVDVARRTDASGRSPILNTFSIGSYPDLVRVRERWSRRVGSWPASVLAAVHVLRTCSPVTVEINGRTRDVWLLFAGNCRYSSWGLAPVRRRDLTDGLLDVRIVDGGRFARTRLVGAALTGVLTSSPIYTEATVRRLRIRLPDAGRPDAGGCPPADGATGPPGSAAGPGVH
ncbi:bifunctional phosphatase PAP2/diacylglycerol kinase family protein, partial [Actinacidiphila rubida]|uniref:bifunctional phosphatase PAP2/diacylglycerol kinase family protein n=1 Tax=Actinacidiphila rubida TaxID=310780 RepID=UPI00210CAAB6